MVTFRTVLLGVTAAVLVGLELDALVPAWSGVIAAFAAVFVIFWH